MLGFFFISAPIAPKIILLPPPWREDSKNGLRFKIRPWEGVEFLIGRMDEQTDTRYCNIDLYSNELTAEHSYAVLSSDFAD